MRFPILSLALTIVLFASPRPLAGQARRAPAGCYVFPAGGAHVFWYTYEPWSRTYAEHRSPYIEFTQTPGDRNGVFLLRAPGMRDSTAQLRFAASSWERIATDSVGLTWGDGLSGMRMRLKVRGDTLEGTVTGFTDVWIEGQRAPTPRPVEGFPVPCPTAPREEDAT